MTTFVSPPIGVIDDEWQTFAAHMHLPAPVFQVISRQMPPVDVEVPVYVFSACLMKDELHASNPPPQEPPVAAASQNAPVHKSWVDALKSTTSKADATTEDKHPRAEAAAHVEKQATAHASAKAEKQQTAKASNVARSAANSSSSTPTGGKGSTAGVSTGGSGSNKSTAGTSATGGSTSRSNVASAAHNSGSASGGNSGATPSHETTTHHASNTAHPRVPAVPAAIAAPPVQQDGKTVMQTATSTIITDAKGVKTVVAKKGATSLAKPRPQPQTVTSAVAAKVTAPSVVTAKPPPKSSTAAAQIVKQTVTSVKPAAAPANLPPHLSDVNSKFDPPKWARYYVIKSYSEDDIHKSIKYSVWASTENGNRRLEQGWKAAQSKGPIYLFFSVNASGQFCGCAQMTSSIDYKSKLDCWADDKWSGKFSVKWVFIKDIPNSHFRHIILENNENKPVTNSRDTQEVPMEKGKEMLSIFRSFRHKTSIIDDFAFYDKRQKEMEDAKTSGKKKSGADDEPEFVTPPREANKRKQQEESSQSTKASKSKGRD